MGIPGSANPMLFGGAAAYQINQSLRFNDAYLSRTPSSAGNRRTFTSSVWLKKSESGAISGFWGAWVASAIPEGRDAFRFDSNSTFRIFFNETTNGNISSNAVYRDFSAWYHVVMAVDTTQATAANRVKLWINGESVSFGSATYPSQNSDLNINNTVAHYVGTAYEQTGQEWQGYMAEFNHVDGTALTPSSFGETDTITGAWIPKKYTGSYGTNGFYLKFDPSATNGIGHDHSGNGNNFTATGFSTSGTGTDVMSDTPTNNYATLNPLQTRGSSLSDGNLVASFTSANDNYASYATHAVSSGKYYLEVTCTSSTTSASNIGFANDNNVEAKRAVSNNAVPGQQGTYGRGVDGTGTLYNGSGISDGSYMAAWSQNDVIMVAIDADSGKFWLGANGSWANGTGSTNQASLIAAAEISLTGGTAPYYFGVGDSSSSVAASFILNAGQRAFAYTPPTGYKALNTANLPEPTIKKGSSYFDTVLWTGNQTARTISMNSTFTPDFIWIKNRTSGYNHSLQDNVRGYGASTKLNSNTTAAENSANTEPQAGYISSVGAGSFSLDASATATWYHNNLNSNAYVGWCWDANGAGSSNTAGTITSTVSANASAGFSIVTYTGNGTGGATIGHGLGVAPKMIIAKSRGGGTYPTADWAVYHEALGASKSLALNGTGGAVGPYSNPSTMWYNTTPTSSLFYVGNLNETNGNNNYVAYCFSEVAGYSKFGSYTGNGSTDGPCVFCGFRPAWIMMKSYTNAGEWYVKDTRRDPYNPAAYVLKANLADQDANNSGFYEADILSTGFKLRTSNTSINQSSQTYIFAAFAELPAKYSNAR